MIGWTETGIEITLSPTQEAWVLQLLQGTSPDVVFADVHGKLTGRSTAMHTAQLLRSKGFTVQSKLLSDNVQNKA